MKAAKKFIIIYDEDRILYNEFYDTFAEAEEFLKDHLQEMEDDEKLRREFFICEIIPKIKISYTISQTSQICEVE